MDDDDDDLLLRLEVVDTAVTKEASEDTVARDDFGDIKKGSCGRGSCLCLLVLLRLRGKSSTISAKDSMGRLSMVWISNVALEVDLVDAMRDVSYPEREASLVSDRSSRIVSVASKASQETRRWREETLLIVESDSWM
jgi:hypothetical protein